MQSINTTVRCAECGCIALADATKCPRCSKTYRKPESNYIPTVKPRNQPLSPHQIMPDVKVIIIVPSIPTKLFQYNNS